MRAFSFLVAYVAVHKRPEAEPEVECGSSEVRPHEICVHACKLAFQEFDELPVGVDKQSFEKRLRLRALQHKRSRKLGFIDIV